MDYSPIVTELLVLAPSAALDEGTPSSEFTHRLESIDEKLLFAPQSIQNRTMARCAVAALWLRGNELDRSHRISQSIETPEGAIWHGIMHRREGDFWNSKYWLRQARRHPVWKDVALRLGEDQYDPAYFVDEVEASLADHESHERLLHIQQVEWETLFDHVIRSAVS